MKLSFLIPILRTSMILSAVLIANRVPGMALSAGSSAIASPREVTLISQNPNQIGIRDVYLIQDGVRTKMQKRAVTLRGSHEIVTYRVRAVLNGEEANIRLTTPRPSFEVFIPSDLYAQDFIYIAELKQKRGRRQVSIQQFSSFDSSSGIRERDRVSINIEELRKVETEGRSYTQYRVTPVEPLESGEYALMISSESNPTPGTLTPATGTGFFYDFGLDDLDD